MSQEIETIKSKLNIVDLVGEYVRLQKAGNNWKACCPFHNEKTPSFSVSEDKQFWHCFGCGKGGDIFGFLMEIEGMSFREALENLAQRSGVELPKYSQKETISNLEKNKIEEILEWSTRFYEKQLWETENGKKNLQYLRERGLTEDIIREFRLGYAPGGWRNILQFLIGKNYITGDILRSGLIIQKEGNGQGSENFYDRFRNRIMFPISNPTGKIIGYSARIAPGEDESQAKYINTPETEVYHKSNVLYGIDKAKMSAKEKNWILLVEGNMDVIAASQAGIKNTVAVSGTALTVEQLGIIKRYTKNIKMFFDMDEAGQKAAKRSAQLAFDKELNVSIVSIEDGKDAADAVKDDADKFIKSIDEAVSAMNYFINQSFEGKNRLDIEDKKKIIEELAGLINSFSNKVEREHWLKIIAEKIGVSEISLREEFEKRNFSATNQGYNDYSAKSESLNNNKFNYDKIKDIQIQIMGTFISDNNLWKEAVARYEEDIKNYFNNPKVVEIILTKGQKYNFNFEKLLDELEDLNQKKFLRELYFENSEKNEDVISTKERWRVVEQYFEQLKREIIKEKNADLIDRIKKAEKSGNKEELKVLTNELMELNKVR
ncbi:MAG: primase protein [Candidatus Moranbacteria bacterium GW2011_GWF1_34_10]|nr:MAG: primase protein [Candidatus Moranbacteria bacterium GW2011_GWF1_34_10]